jgi:hypothetical protein
MLVIQICRVPTTAVDVEFMKIPIHASVKHQMWLMTLSRTNLVVYIVTEYTLAAADSLVSRHVV